MEKFEWPSTTFPAMSCVTCGVPFPLSDAKAHYGTAFHTANLKRRVADLPPLTEAAFARMEKAQSEQAAAALAADEFVLYICDACGKRFGSEGQFAAHNGSKRHRERVRELLAERRAAALAAAEAAEAAAASGGESGMAVEEGGSASSSSSSSSGAEEGGEEGEVAAEEGGLEITSTHCPFCWGPSDSVEANLLHMRAVHSFFVPDAAFCVDLAGLVERLHEIVIEECRCVLGCSAKQYQCPEDAQRHMADKTHCRMRYEEEGDFEAWEAFYDYTDAPEPPAEGVGEVDAAGALVLPGGRVAYTGAIAKYLKQRVALPDSRDSVRTVLHQLALEQWGAEGAEAAGYGLPGGSGGGGGGGSGGKAAVPLARLQAAAARKVGTRGNLTDAVAQQRQQQRASQFSLLVGMNQNQIRRRWFRVATTLTGVRVFVCCARA